MKRLKFNVNDHVLVKLTDKGRDDLREYLGELKEDANGHVRVQLWVLMAACGQHMHMTLRTEDLPFETTMYLEPDS